MVYIPPPQLSRGRPSYAETYNNILSTHRRSPLTSASSVIILVASNVDALCASHMLADLFKQDDVVYRIIPVSGISEMEIVRDELKLYTELHTLILINIGAFMDLLLPEWFGDFDERVSVHVIDSTRPYNLSSIFAIGRNAERIIVWDDGEVEKLEEEKKAWETLEYHPRADSDDESDESESYSDEDAEEIDQDESVESDNRRASGKRKSTDNEKNNSKRRRLDNDRVQRISKDEEYRLSLKISKYYAGFWHGQSACATIYILATVLERVDNDFLWLAILGLTFQYSTSRISRQFYDHYQSIYNDEVSRLNPLPANDTGTHAMISVNPDDVNVRSTDELRFMLFRHWTLYDAMYHSSYVAGKLGIWKERGKKRLTGLLAKMGFSILQTQQPYPHMDMDLKKTLIKKLHDIAPEYGLVELSYPSFMRCFGYHSQPMSAADAVEGLSALLDVAGGVRMEVEIEGSRNGGEWFGGGRVWESNAFEKEGSKKRKEESNENVVTNGETQNTDEGGVGNEKEVAWWVKNFWVAYDALKDVGRLRDALQLSMSLHRAIIRQGTSIIEKQDIRTMRSHRVVVLTQGPDLPLFSHPGVLSRLALWLVDALRDRIPGTTTGPRSKRRSLPFVVACLKEHDRKFVVVGVMAALEFGDVRKNNFTSAFLEARQRCHAETTFGTFDTSIIEIEEHDLQPFLEALCEGPNEY